MDSEATAEVETVEVVVEDSEEEIEVSLSLKISLERTEHATATVERGRRWKGSIIAQWDLIPLSTSLYELQGSEHGSISLEQKTQNGRKEGKERKLTPLLHRCRRARWIRWRPRWRTWWFRWRRIQ